MIQLYYDPGAASMTPHIVLEELRVPFELELVDREKLAHKAPEYLRLNPNGLIPVMVDGDLVLYETAAILLHLADTHPDAELAPGLGTAERAHFYKWMVWLSNTLQATLIVYFYPERSVEPENAACAAQVKAHAEAKVGAMLDQMDTHLTSHGGDWFLGQRYSALDPFAFMLCRWTRRFARPARSLPHLGAYLRRMLDRPAVQRVLATEKLPAPYV
jgi:glutathione S-transferase